VCQVGAFPMQAETTTVQCPECGQPASLGLFQHTDEQGHTLRHDFEFVSACNHSPTEGELMIMWADAHAGTIT
jgi:hypothetical protein